jgi:hypothetical protein
VDVAFAICLGEGRNGEDDGGTCDGDDVDFDLDLGVNVESRTDTMELDRD